MASYPNFDQALGSEPTYLDDRTVDQDVDGSAHVRGYFPARKNQFNLKHFLTRAQLQTLLAFYDANRLNSFDFTWNLDDGVGSPNPTYTCIFSTPPKVTTSQDPQVLEVSVQIRET